MTKMKNDNIEKKPDDLSALVTFVKFGGAFAILFGCINLVSLFSQGYTVVRLSDTLFNIVFGIIFLVCARLLSGRKLISMWVFGSTIVISLVYTYVVGRGVNFFYAIFGGFVLFKFYKLKKDNQIT